MSRFHPTETARAKWNEIGDRVAGFITLSAMAGYLLFLCFPRVLYAHEVVSDGLRVYSHVPHEDHLPEVLARADSLLKSSPLEDRSFAPRIFLASTWAEYAAVSLALGRDSFGKSFGALPVDNAFINVHDSANDRVFREGDRRGRSLSGVIAHEVTHLLVRRRFGYWRNLGFPAWKKEGYAEYVAGGSTLPDEIGVRMWKARPHDATGYGYFRDYRLVKYLLEHEHLTVAELFDRNIDAERLAEVVLQSL